MKRTVALLSALFMLVTLVPQSRVEAVGRVVQGIIYVDENGNGQQDEGEPGLKGVRVTLYRDELTDEVTTENGRAAAHRLLPEKTLTTDAKGSFSAPAPDPFMLIVDTDSLPAGYGLLQTVAPPTLTPSMAVRKVAAIELAEANLSVSLGHEAPVQATLRDAWGNELSGPFLLEAAVGEVSIKGGQLKARGLKASKSRVTVKAGPISKNLSVTVTPPNGSAADIIRVAAREGLLTRDQQGLYLAYALYDESKLPAEYRGTAKDGRSATSLYNELLELLPGVSAETAQTIRAYMPPDLTETSVDSSAIITPMATKTFDGITYNQVVTSAHFEVWYTDDPASPHKLGSTNVSTVSTALEAAWSQLSTLGFTQPSSPYQVYINTKVGKWAGIAYRTCPTCSTSYIYLNPNLLAGDSQAVPPHELFHSSQYYYGTWTSADQWWVEATATWFEDEVYPNNNRYGSFISSYFMSQPNTTNTPLDVSQNLHEYGDVIFVKFVSGWYGGQAGVRQIWDAHRSSPSSAFTTLVDNYLRNSHGQTLANVMGQFHSYNWWPTQYYADAATANWGRPYIIDSQTVVVGSPVIGYQYVNHLASQYVDLRAPSTTSSYVRVLIKGAATGGNSTYAVKLQAQTSTNWNDTFNLTLDGTSAGYLDLWNFGNTYRNVGVVLTNKTWGSTLVDVSKVDYKACYNVQCGW